MGEIYEDETEIRDYISSSGKEKFFAAIEKSNLFIPPGHKTSKDIKKSLEMYKSFLRENRSESWLKILKDLPDELLLFNGIVERITPQFHVRDNAVSLGAQPLFWLPAHNHYFDLCSLSSNFELEENKFIRPQTLAILRGLQKPSKAWLGNIPMDLLVKFREDNLNQEFRTKLKQQFDNLYEASLDDIDKVANEIGTSIDSMLIEHEKESVKIAEKYTGKLLQNLGASILTLGTTMTTWLAPFFGAQGILAIGSKTGLDLLQESHETKRHSMSLTGILSHVKSLEESD